MTKTKGLPLSVETSKHTSILSSSSVEFKGDKTLLNLSPLKAIHRFCVDCSGGSVFEVSKCPSDGKTSSLCPLFQYRFGHNPSRTGVGRTGGNIEALHKHSKVKNDAEIAVEFDSVEAVSHGSTEIHSEGTDGENMEVERG